MQAGKRKDDLKYDLNARPFFQLMWVNVREWEEHRLCFSGRHQAKLAGSARGNELIEVK